MQAQKFKDCIVWKHRLKLFNREILWGFDSVYRSMKFLIFEEYMIERVTFLQSILFFLAFSEIERSLTNLL